MLTNAALNAVWRDPLQRLPQLVTNWGIGVGTAWKKELFNGDVALFVQAEVSTNSFCPVITWDMLGRDTNDFYAISPTYNIFSDFSTWRNNGTITNQGGIFTNFAINLGGVSLVRLHKINPFPMSYVLQTNLVSTNLAFNSPMFVTLPVNGTYIVLSKGGLQGLAATDFPTLAWLVTNGPCGTMQLFQSSTSHQFNAGESQSLESYGYGNNLLITSNAAANGLMGGWGNIAFARPYSDGVIDNNARIEATVKITNAPVSIYFEGINRTTPTTTNTVFAGFTVQVTQIK